MSRRLARTVIVRGEGGTAVAFGPKDDDIPGWAAEQITNPDAWGVEDPPEIEQLQRVGATRAEIAAVRAMWAALSEEERADALEAESQTDEEVAADLAGLRLDAAEQGLT